MTRCGDLHLENVGSFRGDNRLVYFDLNDFDEGGLAPATWEIARFITSVHVAAASLELSAHDAASLAKAFLDAYAEALADGKARWVERATATGMVKELLASVKGRTREALLDSRTVLRGTRRRLRVDAGARCRFLSATEHTSFNAFTTSRGPRRIRDSMTCSSRAPRGGDREPGSRALRRARARNGIAGRQLAARLEGGASVGARRVSRPSTTTVA
ncbi:MAG TPA: DUF2252 family protein [Gemmatimonadaceae bacterium]|nr:DUF2252 family protein [Gemmatimonadaceae bacterium]